MATRAEERERLRLHRVEREAEEQRRDKRLLRLGGVAALIAIGTIAALIAISQGGGSGGDSSIEGAADVRAHLSGIPQSGAFLGSPDAPATVVEFGDLQCPVCRDYSSGVVAELIDGPVREGRARLEFRNWAILGEQSEVAAAAAFAARLQDRQWSFTELFYRNQGTELSGYVTDEFLRAIAEGAGVPNLARWERERTVERWRKQLAANDRMAEAQGFTGTPSFLVEGRSGSLPLGTPHSAADIEEAISGAS
jgi:protein-disulfide isomerase